MFIFIPIVVIAALAGIDQLLKYWVVGALAGGNQIDIIPGVLQLLYHENTGAAFGIFQEKRIILVGVTFVMLLALVFLIVSRKIKEKWIIWGLTLIAGGGIGNLIDRIFRGYVVDYIYFSPINFPVFNFGDCCVVVGTILIMYYILFLEEKRKKGKTQ